VSLDRKQLDALPQRFPRLFKHPLTWGFEHDAGWTNIVEAFCQRIDSALANEPAARFEVLQVKEKFGMLRFYYRLYPNTPESAFVFVVLCSIIPLDPWNNRLEITYGHKQHNTCRLHLEKRG